MNETHDWPTIIDSPLGPLGIRTQGRRLLAIGFPDGADGYRQADDGLTPRVVGQLRDYFSGARRGFELELAPAGTPFQQAVWRALRDIPAGSTMTYGELAARLGTGARAVGNACRANPLPLVIPCHRVVGRSGSGGYMGPGRRGARIKQWLLAHEGCGPAGG